MRIDRTVAAALAVGAAILIGGGAALAANQAGEDTRNARCEERLARIAEKRGVSVAQLEATIKARLTARVEAALEAGRITAEQAARIEARIAQGGLCERPRGRQAGAAKAGLGTRRMLRAAGEFLGLTRPELRAELRGTSLAKLALEQGKTVEGLKAAMLAPAEAKLAKAVEAGRITQARADHVLDRVERRLDRLVARVFPAG